MKYYIAIANAWWSMYTKFLLAFSRREGPRFLRVAESVRGAAPVLP